MDPFNKLPNEIIVQILKSCSDFTSLDGLLQMSPVVNNVFNYFYADITEAVLKSCPMTSHGIEENFQFLVAIYSTTAFTPATVVDFLQRKPGDPFPPALEAFQSFRALDSVAPFKQAVATAAKIHRLACACLDTFIRCIKTTTPSRATVSDGKLYEWLFNNAPDPPAEPFQPKGTHHPHWVEQYRVHRVLWAIQIYTELCAAAETRWSWPQKNIDRLFDRTVTMGHSVTLREDEVPAITECLNDLSPTPLSPVHVKFPALTQLPSPESLAVRSCWALPDVPQETTPISPEMRSWGRTISNARTRGYGMMFYGRFGGSWNNPQGALWRCDTRAFRRLGIIFWDEWRLYQMELIQLPSRALSPEGEYVGGEDERSLLSVAKRPSQLPQFVLCFAPEQLCKLPSQILTQQTLPDHFVLGYSTYFFQIAGLDEAHSFDLGVGVTACGVAGNITSWFIVERVGRRRIFVGGIAALTLLLLLIGIMDVVPTGVAKWLQVSCTVI
ncbi:hypothetical protein CDV55_100122 [Aspergillus turcosus]|uniref:F-box domain-containing protein n=1 Tax=Aspergillus turcosus TaxID=1245748 RepID=A0A397HNE8_9EURO|nr:hypothetical protein CDV55_100122 [Aspergillus turcosus]RLL95243.1 hypothetical protein CFD26_100155 [Aspergillus turcosus]